MSSFKGESPDHAVDANEIHIGTPQNLECDQVPTAHLTKTPMRQAIAKIAAVQAAIHGNNPCK